MCQLQRTGQRQSLCLFLLRISLNKASECLPVILDYFNQVHFWVVIGSFTATLDLPTDVKASIFFGWRNICREIKIKWSSSNFILLCLNLLSSYLHLISSNFPAQMKKTTNIIWIEKNLIFQLSIFTTLPLSLLRVMHQIHFSPSTVNLVCPQI